MEKDRPCLTGEGFEQALRWLNGEPATMDGSDVKAFLDEMLKAFRRRFSEVHPDRRMPRFRHMAVPVLSLASMTGRDLAGPAMTEPPRKEAALEPEPQVDSVTITNAIAHIARLSGRSMTSSRAQMILWCVYGSWLATHGSRLPIEQPQAWKYGPVFPQAWRKASLSDAVVCRDAYTRLSAASPALATLVSSKTLSMLFTAMADLDGTHVRRKDSPYARVMRTNPGAWGTRIPDESIASFFGGPR